MGSTKKVLAVSSSGGHWVQLMRLRPAWDDCEVAYLTTEPDYRSQVEKYAKDKSLPLPRFYITVVATRWQKFRLLRQLLETAMVVLKERPDVIVSTGAAPGFFAIKIGKLFGSKTVWVDSIANVDVMSLSGQKAASSADVWLTQWPELSNRKNQLSVDQDQPSSKLLRKPDYWGSVI
ncbi:UDP-N-acetylglucosamine--LPS N-acetylglucosamine transferase [Kordiimonas sediminis]|uniref:UDP-N-acetylglucosamine--LPS N-acetylglucosamine transferase n=1 Tax=Kordiimonas sediminis TaxID=1735581 RepID=A0A919E984_9PROT|nr:UDP-N-acetylglucosamine--LPS N-acetylglucosamine transferase [Kordiimonas sediminis]GHF25464.1 UDP-N-acetylglucosamine--LPS N-acetylglucosamine transferase [Kordiimonas sediminis]